MGFRRCEIIELTLAWLQGVLSDIVPRIRDVLKDYTSYLLAFTVFLLSIYVSGYVANKIMRSHSLRTSLRPEVLYNVALAARLFTILLGVVLALSIAGVNIGNVLLAAGILGLVVGLAAQQTLGNLFAGIALLLEGRVKVGDTVRIGNDLGVVRAVGLMSSQIRLVSGELLTLPNSALMNSSLYNVSAPIARRGEVVVNISYDSDIDKAVEIIRRTLWNNELVLVEPEPMIIVEGLAESGVNIRVLYWAPTREFFAVRSTIVRDIKNALESQGIAIPYPHRVVLLKGETRSLLEESVSQNPQR
ncbi:MAG: mechanosensitive ion channel family protein [Acidilobaceae archaeon]